MKIKTKISILLPIWQRPDVFDIVLRQLEIFIRQTKKDFDILVFFVYSKEDAKLTELKALISNFKGEYKELEHSNMFLGQKMNAGIDLIRKFDYDFLMNLGSDDLISPKLLALYKKHLSKHDIIGIDSCAFYKDHGNILFLKYYNGKRAVGAGRLISKKAIDTIYKEKLKLYTAGKNRGMDSDSANNLKLYGFTEFVIQTDLPLIVDIKSDTNINDFSSIAQNYKFENLPFTEIENLYMKKVTNKIKDGFIKNDSGPKIEKITAKKIRCLDVRQNVEREYVVNVETNRAIKLGILKEIT